MEFPIITAEAAIVLALLQALLMMRTGFYRAKTSIGMGDAGNEDLLKRIRAHGNLAENSALVLILLGLNELAGLSASILFPIAAVFVLLRLGHAFALSKTTGAHPFRFAGALGTAAVIVILAALLALNLPWGM